MKYIYVISYTETPRENPQVRCFTRVVRANDAEEAIKHISGCMYVTNIYREPILPPTQPNEPIKKTSM